MPRIVSVWLPRWPIERLRRAEPHAAGKPRGDSAGDQPSAPFALVESGARGLTLTAVDEAAARMGLYPGQSLADARAAVPGLATRLAEHARDRAALHALALWCGRYGPHRNRHTVDGVTPVASRSAVSPSAHGGAASRLAPQASATPIEDGLWIDISGVAHLFGGEHRLLSDLAQRLSGFGITVRIALADTFGAAFAMARFAPASAAASTSPASAPCFVVAPGDTAAAIAALPVDALRLPTECVVLLRRLGLRHIGQLYDLPRDALAQRFRDGTASRNRSGGNRPGNRGGVRGDRSQGPATGLAPRGRTPSSDMAHLAGTVLARLDQALGRTPEPLASIEIAPAMIVRHDLDEPLLSAEGVATCVARLASELYWRLSRSSHGGSRFTLGLFRSDGTSAAIGIGLSRPGRNADHITALLAEKLGGFDAGLGIDVMTLSADGIERLPPEQAALPTPGMATDRGHAHPLVDRLSNRLGADRVLRLRPGRSHDPERAEYRVPALSVDAASPEAPAGNAAQARRPPFLLLRPEPIAVTAEVPEGAPLRFVWRRLSRRVLRAEGPERIEPEWWRAIGRYVQQRHVQQDAGGSDAGENATANEGDTASIAPLRPYNARPRDYYTIEDEGGARYWVFRAGIYGRDEDGPPTWFLHGVFA